MEWQLKSGEPVTDRPNTHLHPCAEAHVAEALGRINSNGQQFFIEEVDFGRILGETCCVVTGPNDEIVWAQRPKRQGMTRFVKNRAPEPCSSLVVILMKARGKDYYVLITAFVGHRPEPEPWDQNATANSRPFWASHALVWGHEEVISGTETTECPWERGAKQFDPFAIAGETHCSSCDVTLTDVTGRVRDSYRSHGGTWCVDCAPNT